MTFIHWLVLVALPYMAWTASPNIKMSQVERFDCVHQPHGNDYQGIRSTTVSGYTCQRWDSQFPHKHDRNDAAKYLFAKNNRENYCRNPDHYNGAGPWCFTTDPDVRYESCGIPLCPDCKMTKKGVEYRGTRGVTGTGRTCQRWDSQSPHSHETNDVTKFPDAKYNKENYCRNPDGESDGPWCFTTDPHKTWEYCDIPYCDDCKETMTGVEYRGTRSTTVSGRTCQRWDAQEPHKHDRNDVEQFPDAVYNKDNYCRNSDYDDLSGPWCYTTDPYVRWETCGVPFCTGFPKKNETTA